MHHGPRSKIYLYAAVSGTGITIMGKTAHDGAGFTAGAERIFGRILYNMISIIHLRISFIKVVLSILNHPPFRLDYFMPENRSDISICQIFTGSDQLCNVRLGQVFFQVFFTAPFLTIVKFCRICLCLIQFVKDTSFFMTDQRTCFFYCSDKVFYFVGLDFIFAILFPIKSSFVVCISDYLFISLIFC